MVHDSQLPCDGDGLCMCCKATPPPEETLQCTTCATPWHMDCLASKPETLADTLLWECPDCSGEASGSPVPGGVNELTASIREIEADPTLTEKEKAEKRQALMTGKMGEGKEMEEENDLLNLIDKTLKCSFCMLLPEKPVTTPCGHNFCLKCFQRWVRQGKNTCAKCRFRIPSQMATEPRVNSALVAAIRIAKLSRQSVSRKIPKANDSLKNEDRPDEAYTTERAKKGGKANASSGRLFMTVPRHHFGPITAEYDPERNIGLRVGKTWSFRMECRQWGAHMPPIAGIAGQAKIGAQSVVLSGGYVDDEDHGEWFLYTGSGGRDLNGNKRTNTEQTFDQEFTDTNQALRVSCKKGYPVRVLRSEKGSPLYAPEKGLRYDGVYRVEKCWRKVGIQGFKVCRYLFVRCDNEPAPWTRDEHGDQPRPLPFIEELTDAIEVTERNERPSWDYDEQDCLWKWKIPPPVSREKHVSSGNDENKRPRSRKAKNMNLLEQLLEEFKCQKCKKVMNAPVTTPCAHNFCKSCIDIASKGKNNTTARNKGGRDLRTKKKMVRCLRCPTDITDFLEDPKINRDVMTLIEDLQRNITQSVEDSGSNMETGEETKIAKKRQKVDSGSSSGKTDEKIEDRNDNLEKAEKPESYIVEISEPEVE